jgi:hypothetical protein
VTLPDLSVRRRRLLANFTLWKSDAAGAGTDQAKPAAMCLELAYESERRSEQRYGFNYLPQHHRVLPVGPCDQKPKGRSWPEFTRFDLAYLTGASGKRDHPQNKSRPGEARHNLSDALPA